MDKVEKVMVLNEKAKFMAGQIELDQIKRELKDAQSSSVFWWSVACLMALPFLVGVVKLLEWLFVKGVPFVGGC